ncbi:hypothetical protein BPC006_II2238 [Burkholderia pseudomallei BPC006]|nr:hypothetical protein BPC006_II2238 [Burkholderia pseudomallei BPC006]
MARRAHAAVARFAALRTHRTGRHEGAGINGPA